MTLAVTTTQTTELKLRPAMKTKLLRELRAYAELKAQQRVLEAAMDKHKATIRGLREEVGVETLKLDGFTSTNVTNIRSSLDKMKLLEMGVTTDMLEEATVSKPGRPYEKISCPGDKSREE